MSQPLSSASVLGRARTSVAARSLVVAAYAGAMAFAACTAAVSVSMVASAQEAQGEAVVETVDASLAPTVIAAGTFVKKAQRVDGGWSVVTRPDGVRVVRFDDAFSTRGAPDLKVFLSPTQVEGLNGRTATNEAVLLGALQSTSGAQEYEIPADLDLSAFASVLVHCEAFSKLWGGGNL